MKINSLTLDKLNSIALEFSPAKMLMKNGPALTYPEAVAYSLETDDGKLVALGGVFLHWEGVAEAWVISTPLAKKHLRSLIRLCYIGIDESRGKFNLHRLHMDILADEPKSQDFAEYLGFKKEAYLDSYTFAQKDVIRYRMVKRGVAWF